MNTIQQCAILLWANRTFPGNTDIEYYGKLVWYAHQKGWLYIAKENGDVSACGIAYRVPDKSKATCDALPEESEGEILYCTCVASRSNKRFTIRKLLRAAKKRNEAAKVLMFHRLGGRNGKE